MTIVALARRDARRLWLGVGHRRAGAIGDEGSDVAYRLNDGHLEIEGREILNPLILDLPGGQVVGLIGQNGSGKSSLIKLPARQVEPCGGAILYDARPMSFVH